jgi:PAS domain S-box-containing protein
LPVLVVGRSVYDQPNGSLLGKGDANVTRSGKKPVRSRRGERTKAKPRAAKRTVHAASPARATRVQAKRTVGPAVADRLEAERARLGHIVALSSDAIIGIDLDDLISAWNTGAERMLGHTSRKAMGRRWTMLFPPDLLEELERLHERAKDDQPIYQHDTVMVTRDNCTLPVSVNVFATKDLGGRIVGTSLVARDMTERKSAEERQRLLLAELNHRVKNTLATVISIANQSLRDAESLESFGASFIGRVRALAKTQELLTRSSWSGVPLREVLAAECAPYEKRNDGNLARSGPDVALTAKAVLSIALVIHELMTNAVKHGALSRPRGRVNIEWALIGAGSDQFLRINWSERGGPTVAPPRRRGFGRTLIEEGLAHELNARAQFDFAPAGLTCQIEIPAREVVAESLPRDA